MCAMQWFTPIRGIFHSKDKVLATNAQTFNGGPMPGPLVYAINAKFYYIYLYHALIIILPLLRLILLMVEFV